MFGRLATSFGIVLFVSSLASAGQNSTAPTPQSQQPAVGQTNGQGNGSHSKSNKGRHHRKHRKSGKKGSTAPTTPPANTR
jgi:hypothetical protein